MSWLIVPVTVILLRGAFQVLLLAGAETIGEDFLSARVRRALWILCLFLMMIPHPNFSFQPFVIDLTDYRNLVIRAADILPREIARRVSDMELAYQARDYFWDLTGLSYHNYPYLLALLLAIVPALFLLAGSYWHCRQRVKGFKELQDERILKIWNTVRDPDFPAPLLLDSGEKKHAPLLFGFFRQNGGSLHGRKVFCGAF